MVPFDYWKTWKTFDCVGWLDDVDENFQFFVECMKSFINEYSEHSPNGLMRFGLYNTSPFASGGVANRRNSSLMRRFAPCQTQNGMHSTGHSTTDSRLKIN